MQSVPDFIAQIHTYDCQEDVWKFALRFLKKRGLNRVCHGYSAGGSAEEKLILRNNYSDFWAKIYYEKEVYKHDWYAKYVAEETKPIVADSFRFDDGFIGSELHTEILDTPNESIDTGVIIPLRLMRKHSFGGIFIGAADSTKSESQRYIAHQFQEIILLGLHLDAALVTLATSKEVLDINLSPREVDCLHYLAQGLLNDRIAEKLKISTHTVEYHIRNARLKLVCRTREQALAKAVSLGILHF